MQPKPNLLIVEDDSENQKFLNILLRNLYQIEICDSSATCYDKLINKKFDIILMDISLHGKKDGLQLTRELKANLKFKDIPIVVLTAHAFQKDKDAAQSAGANLYLTKPILKNHLVEALEKVLRQNLSKN